MKTKIDQKDRAKRAWEVLTQLARGKRTTTYGDLGRRIGIHYRACRFPLGWIQDHCHRHGLPPLQSLVVAKASDRPGRGYIATPRDDIQRAHESVFSFDWSKTPNPF